MSFDQQRLAAGHRILAAEEMEVRGVAELKAELDDTNPLSVRRAMPESVPTVFLPSPDVELEDWGPLEEATGPEMQTSGISIWEDGNGADSGIWECTPGPSHWTLETNEFIYVVSGRMTVTPEGGEPLELEAGNSAVFPKGWTGTWDIHETLRKLYVIY